jgi:hypothetical protein
MIARENNLSNFCRFNFLFIGDKVPTIKNASPTPERLELLNKYSEVLKKIALSLLKK